MEGIKECIHCLRQDGIEIVLDEMPLDVLKM